MDREKDQPEVKKTAEDIPEVDRDLEDDGHEEGTPSHTRKNRWIIGVIVIALIFILLSILSALRKFDSIEVVSSVKDEGASSSSFWTFKGDILKVSRDGAILADEEGHVVWNESYEMTDPAVRMKKDYCLIYDRGGSVMDIFDGDGLFGQLETDRPIADADVADTGTVASLMQDGGDAKIEIHSPDKRLLAAGEIHLQNGSYPTTLALSPDAKRLLVSEVDLSEGGISSKVRFYNFSGVGKQKIDNIVAEYTYKDTLVPKICFTDSGKALAFAGDRIVLYTADASPKELKVVKPGKEMKAVFSNDRYFGCIVPEKDKDGRVIDTVEMWSMHGLHRYSAAIGSDYSMVDLLPDNELMLSDGRTVTLYNLFGTKHFQYKFDNTVYSILPIRAGKVYQVVYQNRIDRVRLK